jgi:predicted outer membrane repeat protein
MANKLNVITRFAILVFFAVLGSYTAATGTVIYVDGDAVGANDGSSWENACLCLQDALEDVRDFLEDAPAEAQTDYEIRVANGIYKPDRRTSEGSNGRPLITTSGDWKDTFVLENVTMKGGYAGYGEPDPNARDIDLYETILSGDLYGNDLDVSSDHWWEESSRAENSLHVVIGQGNSVLDGFTITGGNANESSHLHNDSGGGLLISSWGAIIQITNCTFTGNSALFSGGGIYTHQGDLILTNCTFTRNLAGSSGGAGIYNYNSSLSLTNCTFIENSTRYGEGGGIYNEMSGPSLVNCTFIENSARRGGGISNNDDSYITLTKCKFIRNSASDQGGGIYNFISKRSNPTIRNCLFTGNHSGFRGGGIYNYWGEPVLTNCTFAGNWAGEGNALYCKSDQERNTVTLTNCILWDFGTEIETWNNGLSIINVSYSNIRGGWFGEGNIDEDPLFVDMLGPDYMTGTEDDNLRLFPLSPCVDSGDPNYVPEPNETDLNGNRRIINGRIDMGAYERHCIIYVDDDAPDDAWRGEPEIGYPQEDGTEARPFDTIQEAIDIAKDGYTILVRPGVYGKIDFKGKAITVTGTEGAAVIEAPPELTGDHDAVTFHTGEGRGSVLKNFIIRNSHMAISINSGSPKIHNITIVGNNYGIAAYDDSNPDISNCIFWHNRFGDLFQCECRYSCIESRIHQGKGNIHVNPLFVDAANGDYHLKSEGWRWNTNSESWTWDDMTSLCIDAGDPCSPLGDELMSVPRDPDNIYGVNRHIDMGAYGGTCQASMLPRDWTPPEEDTTPPAPDPAQWAPNGAPRAVYDSMTRIQLIEMEAAQATDASGLVEYFFDCTTSRDLSSGWQSSRTYSVEVNVGLNEQHSFRVKARDLYLNETAWSEERTAARR